MKFIESNKLRRQNYIEDFPLVARVAIATSVCMMVALNATMIFLGGIWVYLYLITLIPEIQIFLGG